MQFQKFLHTLISVTSSHQALPALALCTLIRALQKTAQRVISLIPSRIPHPHVHEPSGRLTQSPWMIGVREGLQHEVHHTSYERGSGQVAWLEAQAHLHR